MIKFFGTIRQNLLMENKTSKYLKYAIGEIFLVMVGILLALQVSNWNQQRIAEQKEGLLLEALNDEFIDNKSQLERVISIHERALASNEYAISQFPINLETINLDTFNEGVSYWGNWNTFNPSQGVIRSLVNTSSFELISDPELRVLLVSWEDVLADYKEEEDIAVRDLYEHLFPLMSPHFSWSKTPNDNRKDKAFMTTLEFENIFGRRKNILQTILGLKDENSELAQIKTTIDRIIELSKPDEK